MKLSECKRDNLCVDCDSKTCLRAGDIMADCPKYHCDNTKGIQECANCDFIKDYQKSMREGCGGE